MSRAYRLAGIVRAHVLGDEGCVDGATAAEALAELERLAADGDAYAEAVDALRRIAAHPHGGILVNVARYALEDSPPVREAG